MASCDPSDLATVGHDLGRLVLRLERGLNVAPALVCEELGRLIHEGRGSFDRREGAEARWEADPLGTGAFVVLIAFIPVDDLDLAATIGAEQHLLFTQLIRALDATGDNSAPDDCTADELVDAYASLFAAALADTD